MNDNMAVQILGEPLTSMKLPYLMRLVSATSSNGLRTSAVRGLQKLLEDEVNRGGTLSSRAPQFHIHEQRHEVSEGEATEDMSSEAELDYII